MMHRRIAAVLRLGLILSLLAPLARAADFPPITDEERNLTAVPGEPNAPAVVLFKKGEFSMWGYGYQSGSLLRIQTRVKVLTEEGKRNAEIVIAHGSFLKLQNFEARTVLPGGRVVPVGADAKFVRKTSRSENTFVTAVAFPAVEPGAILDYQYDLVFDSIFYLQPWYFSEDIPVRHSEIVFKTPLNIRSQAWNRTSRGVKIQKESHRTPRGVEVRAWADNLPSVPDDPWGPPFTDLATQMLLIPVSAVSSIFDYYKFFESWPQICASADSEYDPVRRKDRGVADRARAIAPSGTPRERSEALYRFVRDQIQTVSQPGVGVDSVSSLAKVLSDHRGDCTQKALLLQSMLGALRIGSRLVWAADRSRGAIDPQLPYPGWFDTVLVMVELDGKRVFLDPSNRALGFGQLRYGYEGTPALIHDAKKPEGIVLPETPFDQNLRRAEIELTLDEKGRLAGTGTLLLTGHHAWERTYWKDDEAKTLAAWKEWLAQRYREFQIADVKAVERPDERKVTVTWSMSQREDEALGDEAVVSPSAPVGPRTQPFVQPVSSRRSAVLFDYPDREEVELHLRWPERWKIDARPRGKTVVNVAGALASELEVREGEHSLVYKRRVDLTRRELGTAQEYEAVRSLFGELEKTDAQTILLVRR